MERPILMSGPMVRAILAGRKTQTRRLVTPGTSVVGTHEPWDHLVLGGSRKDGDPERFGEYLHVPHRDGETVHRVYPRIGPGDLLWVRETWRAPASDSPEDLDDTRRVCVEYAATEDHAWREVLGEQVDVGAWCERWLARNHGGWNPSIHMPRWASRLTLRVESVRVERVRSITEEDARAEGVDPDPHPLSAAAWGGPHRLAFGRLWDSINGTRAPWASNPWVWVVTFSRVEVG